ncbi:MAG: hypothetical protein Q4C95_11090 [Planctomycetia bacterium]|nr:hypothetical protein [Planctomycetia bacterium]
MYNSLEEIIESLFRSLFEILLGSVKFSETGRENFNRFNLFHASEWTKALQIVFPRVMIELANSMIQDSQQTSIRTE